MMEQRVAYLESAFTQLANALRSALGRIGELEKAQAEAATAPVPAATPKTTSRKRRPKNQGDARAVMAQIQAGVTVWREIAKATGVPDSTCRSYGKMTEAEIAALPVLEEDDADSDIVSTGVVDPNDGKEIMQLREPSQPTVQQAVEPQQVQQAALQPQAVQQAPVQIQQAPTQSLQPAQSTANPNVVDGGGSSISLEASIADLLSAADEQIAEEI